MPEIIASTDPEQTLVSQLIARLEQSLSASNVLLLLSGGSLTKVYAKLAQFDPPASKFSFFIGQVDERYDPNPLHADSNNKAIRDTGLVQAWQESAEYYPILHGNEAELESQNYATWLAPILADQTWHVIALLGIGPDGHTAGMLPDSDPAFKQEFCGENLVSYYRNNGPFPERITLTMPALKSFDETFVYAVGANKLPVITQALAKPPAPLHQLPATIIQDMPNVTIITSKEN